MTTAERAAQPGSSPGLKMSLWDHKMIMMQLTPLFKERKKKKKKTCNGFENKRRELRERGAERATFYMGRWDHYNQQSHIYILPLLIRCLWGLAMYTSIDPSAAALMENKPNRIGIFPLWGSSLSFLLLYTQCTSIAGLALSPSHIIWRWYGNPRAALLPPGKSCTADRPTIKIPEPTQIHTYTCTALKFFGELSSIVPRPIAAYWLCAKPWVGQAIWVVPPSFSEMIAS